MLARWLYFRGLGFSALCATLAFWAQMPGLVGSRGLWPAADTMAAVRAQSTFWQSPTLTWLSTSDAMLHLLCGASVALSLLLLANLAPRPALLALFAVWLSLVQVGGPFLRFQWDILLCEALFWSVFYAPSGLTPGLAALQPAPGWARLIVYFIGFKVSFCSGVVKLASGDPVWRDLTALSYHHWSQPLPNPVSYLLGQLGDTAQRLLCVGVFVFELALPLFAFGPKQARWIAGASLCALQFWVFVTGNFAYFNVLCFALAIPLFDDEVLRWLFPRRWRAPERPVSFRPSPLRWPGRALAALVIVGSTFAFFGHRRGFPAPQPLAWVLDAAEPFNLFGSYGAFAVMTRTRPEIILEGSNDGVTWQPYEFKWKPGRLDRMPSQIAPWQPRLDWQMWFAALGVCQHSPWLLSLQRELLKGNPDVLALLEDVPFKDHPPQRMRSTVYQYRFAPLAAKGQYWTRELQGPFCPEVTLDGAGNLVRAAP